MQMRICMCVFIARVMTALKLTSEIKSASNCSLGKVIIAINCIIFKQVQGFKR